MRSRLRMLEYQLSGCSHRGAPWRQGQGAVTLEWSDREGHVNVNVFSLGLSNATEEQQQGE
jgi:hypothetical protein